MKMVDPPEAPSQAPTIFYIEQALLGSILVDNQALEQLRPLLKPEHFYDPLHARIFETMSQAFERGSFVPTPLTLNAAMKADPGLIGGVGGVAYLAGLALAAPALPNVRDYARILQDLAMRRRLAGFGGLLNGAALLDPSVPVSDTIAAAQAEMREIAAEAGGESQLAILDASKFHGQKVPAREEFVEGLIPRRAVTLLGGDGGTGKSLLALQLAVSARTGMDWAGRVVFGKVRFSTFRRKMMWTNCTAGWTQSWPRNPRTSRRWTACTSCPWWDRTRSWLRRPHVARWSRPRSTIRLKPSCVSWRPYWSFWTR